MKTIVNYMRTFLILIGISISATVGAVVTFTPTSDYGESSTSYEKSGVTIQLPVGGGILNNGSEYRWYSSATNKLTISSASKIIRIKFTASSGYSTSSISVSSGGGSISSGTWTNASGSNSVQFLNGNTQIRFSKIEVTLDASGCDLMVYNGSSYIVWKHIENEDPLPLPPPIDGYYYWTNGSELAVWSTSPITSSPCITYISSETNYRFVVASPYLPKHYPNGATTLYAVYGEDGGSGCQTTGAPYVDDFVTVTFKANGGTGSDYTQQVLRGSSTALLPNRFTNGCNDFAGWATSSGGSVAYVDKASITTNSNKTLWAKWTPHPFTIMTEVSPVGGGTATIAGETITELNCGTTGHALVAAPAAGYYFKNWDKDPNNSTGGTIASPNTLSTTYNVGTEDATLTAIFLQYLTLTYDANGGSGAPAAKEDCQSGVNFTLSSTEPTRSNYVFLGWNTSNTATSAQKAAGDSYSITSNTTLYAVWCPNISGSSFSPVVSGTTPTFNYSTGKGSTTFSWGAVTNATGYQLVIRNITDGEDVYSNSVSASSSYTFTNMIPGKTYRATVTASNACTNVSSSADKSIACPSFAWPEAPAMPIVVSTPGKFAATVTFTITNAVSFEVWLTDGTAAGSEVAGSRSTINANSSGVASKEFTGLSSDHTYYVHATGENVCGEKTSEKQDIYFETAHDEVYDTYQFTCVDFTATAPSGKALITSGFDGTNPKTVLAKHPVRLTITGGIPNHYVQIEPSDPNVLVYFIKEGSPNTYQVVNASNQLRIANDGSFAKDIYFAYAPSAHGDGSVTVPTFTIRCDGFEETFNADGSLLKVRALPNNFAVIAHTGNTWNVLPADMGNSNGTQSGSTVRVNEVTHPTIVYTELADNAYRLWPIGGPTSTRFQTISDSVNGSMLRLSMPNNLYNSKALAFGASVGSTAIGAFYNATLTESNSTVGAHFYWDVTTMEEVDGGTTYFKYQLKNPTNTNYLTLSGHKWGMYNTGVQEVWLVPIEDTKDAELTIMEWGKDSLVFRYPGNGTITLTELSINNSAIGTATMERIATSDLYTISGLSTLQLNPSKTLQITITETISETSTIKESLFTIPFIIASGETRSNTDLRDLMDGATVDAKYAIAKNVDVVVRQGGQFETVDANGKFNDLYIYPGGKVDLAYGLAHLNNIYLRGGFSWLGNPFGLPQMKTADNIFITGLGTSGNGVFYDLNLNSNIYYMMALPKDVALNAVTNEEGGADWNAWVKGYSGKPRSLNPQNRGWSWVTGDNLERGKGYEIAIQPRLGRPYGTLRFPLLTSSAWNNETGCAPAVVAWGMTDGDLDKGVTANNAGWNFIGNPFFTAYNNTVGEESIIIADSLKKELDDKGNWTGKYVWFGERVKFFTIPSYTTEDYKDVRSTPYKLDAFYPFFVQVNSGTEASPASLTFGTGNRSLKMPKRYSISAQQRESMIDFTLSDDNDNSDVAGLDISNEYSSGFDSDDKEKTILGGEKYMKVYTIVGDYRVAFNSLPEESAAKPILVGVITPEAGYYTFSLLDGLDVSEVDHIWLYDYEKTMQTDLLVDDYRFYGTHGQLDDRFAINVILKADEDPGISTQMDDAMIESSHDQPQKFIYQGHLYILYHDVIFDATGKKVSEIK